METRSLFCGVLIGAAAGSLVFAAWLRFAATPGGVAHAPCPCAATVELSRELLRRTDELSKLVSALSTNYVVASPQRAPIPELSDRDRAAVGGDAAASEADAGTASDEQRHWLSALDADVGRVLVERGLTPYSPGVAPLLTRVGDELRAARSEYERACLPLQRALQDPRPGDALQITRDLQNLGERYNERRRALAEELARGLNAR